MVCEEKDGEEERRGATGGLGLNIYVRMSTARLGLEISSPQSTNSV